MLILVSVVLLYFNLRYSSMMYVGGSGLRSVGVVTDYDNNTCATLDQYTTIHTWGWSKHHAGHVNNNTSSNTQTKTSKLGYNLSKLLQYFLRIYRNNFDIF